MVFNYKDIGISIREGGFTFLKKDRGWDEKDENR
jgi:DNA polymerase sigma